jgi:hypothetical protein
VEKFILVLHNAEKVIHSIEIFQLRVNDLF